MKSNITVASYNVTASFFDKKTPEHSHHNWVERRPYVLKMLEDTDADVFGLQELSPEQAHEIAAHFEPKGYQWFFLSQTPSEVPVGEIARGSAHVKGWIGKNVGTALLGIGVRQGAPFLGPPLMGRFWLNERPNELPTLTDRAVTDKGFGNMNTYRAVFHARLTFLDDSVLFFFNTHYPLSGGNKTRVQCARMQRKQMELIAGELPWVAVGDMNTISLPEEDTDEFNPTKVLDTLGKSAIEISRSHKGMKRNTWIGFTYDQWFNPINEKGRFERESQLDHVVVSRWLPVVSSVVRHGAYDPVTGKILRKLPINDPKRHFASDHALVMVTVSIFDYERQIRDDLVYAGGQWIVDKEDKERKERLAKEKGSQHRDSQWSK